MSILWSQCTHDILPILSYVTVPSSRPNMEGMPSFLRLEHLIQCSVHQSRSFILGTSCEGASEPYIP